MSEGCRKPLPGSAATSRRNCPQPVNIFTLFSKVEATTTHLSCSRQMPMGLCRVAGRWQPASGASRTMVTAVTAERPAGRLARREGRSTARRGGAGRTAAAAG